MLFNSYVFVLLFLPLSLLGWWGLSRWPSVRLGTLVVLSFVFYGWWHWEFTLLLLASTIIDYWLGLAIHRTQGTILRRCLLGLSLTSNLGMLGYFKYSGFLATVINDISTALQMGSHVPVLEIMLPVGISFYTFQTLTYTVDLYKREIEPARSLMHFAAYVSMFPQLIAGPIVRFSDIEEQMKSLSRRPDWDQIAIGIWFFVIGMCQKILVADAVAKLVVPILSEPEQLQLVSGWLGLIGYSVQLYFDFAGYSNMAIGLGLFLGFSFPQNFDSPYQSRNIQEFWRRWHMSLSSFLRDYLYIPLGGNRRGAFISYRNLLLVMLIGGLWHGAGWTFLLWGALHGVLLVVCGLYRAHIPFKLPTPISMAATLMSVMLGWLLFRSTNLTMADDWFKAIVGLRGVEADWGWPLLLSSGAIITMIALAFCLLAPNTWRYRPKFNLMTAIALSGLLWICILRFDSESPFLYFQF